MKCFISYSRKDLEFVKRLASDLKGKKVDIWVDYLNNWPGDRWRSNVIEALKNCEVIIPVLSESSVTSDHVDKELVCAEGNKKTFIPLLLSHCEIPYSVRGIHLKYFTKDDDYAKD